MSALKFEGCTPAQVRQLTQAINTSRTMTERVLQLRKSTSTRQHRDEKEYRARYFGDISPTNDEYANSVLLRILDNLDKTIWTCSPVELEFCATTTAAFVQGYNDTVTFCPEFLEACQESLIIDALVSTIVIHEMTHTKAVGGSNRIIDMWFNAYGASAHFLTPWSALGAYGQFRAQQLAFWSSGAAVLNADNYALYVQAAGRKPGTFVLPAEQIDRSLTILRSFAHSKYMHRRFYIGFEYVRPCAVLGTLLLFGRIYDLLCFTTFLSTVLCIIWARNRRSGSILPLLLSIGLALLVFPPMS